jgi:hypothetical protein
MSSGLAEEGLAAMQTQRASPTPGELSCTSPIGEQDSRLSLATEKPSPDGVRLLLVTTVDIGEGRSDRIEVRSCDDVEDVAAAFVAKHGLPTAIKSRLAAHLMDNLAKVEANKATAVSGQVVLVG